MSTPANGLRRESLTHPSLLLAAVALALGAVAAVRLLADTYSPPVWMAVEYGLTFVLPAILMYGAYWLATSDFDAEELWQTLWWTVGGVVALTVVSGFVLSHRYFEGGELVEPVFTVAVLALVGGVGGFGTAVTQFHDARVLDQRIDPGPSNRAPVERRSHGHATAEATRKALTDRDADAAAAGLFQSRSEEQSLSRQWRTLEAVAECGDCTLEEVATALARDPRNSFGGDPEAVALLLYHVYLPAVAETGLVAFDAGSRLVVYRGPETLAF